MSAASFLVVNARLIDPGSGLDRPGALWVRDGVIAALGEVPAVAAAAPARVIDARGRALLPGLVDLGFGLPADAADARAHLAAAARGGVTAVVSPDPTRVAAPGLPRIHAPPAGVTWLRPHDPAFGAGVVAAGAYATRLGLAGLPEAAEVAAVQRVIAAVRTGREPHHLARLSTAAALAQVRQARAEGLPLSCDIGINHLHLTELDIGFYDAHCHLRPPLRTQRDRMALAQGLADGTIAALVSDHTVLGPDDKLAPFAETVPGAAGAGLLFSLAYKWARDSGLPLARALACVTSGPAALAGLAGGRLAVGAPADLCLADLDDDWLAPPAAPGAGIAATPFAGMMQPGRVCAAWVGGHPAWETSF